MNVQNKVLSKEPKKSLLFITSDETAAYHWCHSNEIVLLSKMIKSRSS